MSNLEHAKKAVEEQEAVQKATSEEKVKRTHP